MGVPGPIPPAEVAVVARDLIWAFTLDTPKSAILTCLSLNCEKNKKK